MITKEGMTAYLARFARHVGPKRAERLWDLYGANAAEMVRNDPRLAAGEVPMPAFEAEMAADDLAENATHETAWVELLSVLAGRGFYLKELIPRAVALWKGRAAEVIRRNPYTLLVRRMPGAGWARCDKLYLDLGGKPQAPKRQVLALVHWLESQHGDTWHDGTQAVLALRRLIPQCDPRAAVRAAVRWGRVAVRQEPPRTYLALGEAARDEKAVAERLKEMTEWAVQNRQSV